MLQTLCTATGPGSAGLAGSWASTFGLSNVHVWGDTTDYMYENFASTVGGAYPNTLVIDLDTMQIRYFDAGDVSFAESTISEILAEPHPCAE